jgi:archaellin
LKDNGAFDSMDFVIRDTKTVSYDYLRISFTRDTNDVSSTFFTDLKATLATAEKEKGILNNALLLKEAVKNDLSAATLIMDESKISASTKLDKSHSAYNAIHFSSSFAKDLTVYRDFVTSLNDTTSENYVSKSIWKNNASLNDFLPYASFSVSLTSDSNNVLPDKYQVKTGDTFLLHSFKAVGDSSNTEELTDETITFTDAKGKAFSTDYYSFDSNTKVLTIKALPSTSSTLIITVSSGSYSKLTYRFLLNA